ncbi:MAG: hypothetical protein AAF515_11905 [Pseudomonadota bacterium]
MMALLTAATFLGVAHAAEQPRPAFLQPEVLRAAAAIDMTDAQMSQFREAISEFADARISMINKLRRRSNQTDLPRKIRSKTNGLLRKLDKRVLGFLTEDQASAYDVYRNLLKDNMRP